MQIDGAVIREQGLTFAIVCVKSHVLQNTSDANASIIHYRARCFQGVPVVLMAQDARGVPTYYGRPDIVRFMANVSFGAVPWKRYTFS